MSDQSKEQNLYKLRDNLVEMRDGLQELQKALEKLHRALLAKQRSVIQGTATGSCTGNGMSLPNLPLREDPVALTDLVRRMADGRVPSAGEKNMAKPK